MLEPKFAQQMASDESLQKDAKSLLVVFVSVYNFYAIF